MQRSNFAHMPERRILCLHLLIIFRFIVSHINSVGAFWGCGYQGWGIITWYIVFAEEVNEYHKQIVCNTLIRDRFCVERLFLQRIGRYRKSLVLFKMSSASLQVILQFWVMDWFLSLSRSQGVGREEHNLGFWGEEVLSSTSSETLPMNLSY